MKSNIQKIYLQNFKTKFTNQILQLKIKARYIGGEDKIIFPCTNQITNIYM